MDSYIESSGLSGSMWIPTRSNVDPVATAAESTLVDSGRAGFVRMWCFSGRGHGDRFRAVTAIAPRIHFRRGVGDMEKAVPTETRAAG
jgi:hypothetical protein